MSITASNSNSFFLSALLNKESGFIYFAFYSGTRMAVLTEPSILVGPGGLDGQLGTYVPSLMMLIITSYLEDKTILVKNEVRP